jgi:hypothetical protein
MDSVRLPLSRGLYAVIDAADFELVGRHKWCAIPSRGTWYAMRGIRRHGLNNRRSNLRHCSNQENCRNQGLAKSNRSGYKGVSWYPNYQKWVATIVWNGRKVFLGYYTDPVEAARAYDARARELFGAFARPNFPAE